MFYPIFSKLGCVDVMLCSSRPHTQSTHVPMTSRVQGHMPRENLLQKNNK